MICEMFYGDLKPTTEIAEELNMDANRVGQTIEQIMFLKKYDEFTADRLEILRIRSKV